MPTSKGSPTAGPPRRKTFLEKEKRESLIWKGDEVFRCQGVRGAGRIDEIQIQNPVQWGGIRQRCDGSKNAFSMSRPTPCTPRFHQVRRKRLFHRFQFPQTSQLNSTPVSNAAANASPFPLDPWIMPYSGWQDGYMPLDECLAASRDLAPSPGPRRKPNTPNIWFKAELTSKTNHSSLQNHLSCGFPPGKSIHPWTP